MTIPEIIDPPDDYPCRHERSCIDCSERGTPACPLFTCQDCSEDDEFTCDGCDNNEEV